MTVAANGAGECDSTRTDYNGSRIAATYNQGVYGEDPMGLVWMYQDSVAGSCPSGECGGSAAGLLVRNGGAVVAGQPPAAYPHALFYVDCREAEFEYFYSGDGILLGYGDTPDAARADAERKLSW